MTELLRLVGAPGSPYSRKLRALMRYRRIPHHWITRGWRESEGLPEPRVPVIPVLVYPDGEAANDTTPLIRRLEREHAGRSVVPGDPVVSFLDELLEDYADEWLTKCMFHYRWAFAPDVAKAAAVLPRWSRVDATDEQVAPFSKMFSERQIARLWVVGSNETTAPTIEQSYLRLLDALDARLTESPFVLGRRPASCDFAIYGQLTQLVLFDPTPAKIAIERAPRVYAWVEGMEELSGWEPGDGDWVSRDAIPDSLRALLAEVGRVHAPFLLANAAALESGAERVEGVVDGRPWVQKPFPYQGKCLGWLRDSYAALGDADRAALDGVLSGTGCEVLFA